MSRIGVEIEIKSAKPEEKNAIKSHNDATHVAEQKQKSDATHVITVSYPKEPVKEKSSAKKSSSEKASAKKPVEPVPSAKRHVQVSSAEKPEILLKVVQVLTDRNLTITYAKFSSPRDDSFEHVFDVADKDGQKIKDEGDLADQIIRKLEGKNTSAKVTEEIKSPGCTSFEIEGSDRPEFLSEVSDVLITYDKCDVVNAQVWTDNTCTKGVIQIPDKANPSEIKKLLDNVLNGSNKLSDDFLAELQRPVVYVLPEKANYSEVQIQSKKRPKLLFDVVRTLTDMQYAVCGGNFQIEGTDQSIYKIRHVDNPIQEITEVDRKMLVHYLEAAIEGRVSKAIKLELCTDYRIELLSEITKIFWEKKLNVTKAEVTTRSGKALCTFYLLNKEPEPGQKKKKPELSVDSKIIVSIRDEIRKTIFKPVNQIGDGSSG